MTALRSILESVDSQTPVHFASVGDNFIGIATITDVTVHNTRVVFHGMFQEEGYKGGHFTATAGQILEDISADHSEFYFQGFTQVISEVIFQTDTEHMWYPVGIIFAIIQKDNGAE